MSKMDLHIHSNISGDGEFSPLDIIRQCRAQGMELVALADHNSVRGLPEVLEVAGEIQVISGVELDCVYRKRHFHLLGYGIDHTRDEFSEIEKDILRQEINAGEEKVRLFTKATGISVDIEEALTASGNGVITGELIAELLLAREDAETHELLHPYLPGGTKSDMPNVRFYWDFFSEGKPAHVPMRYFSLPDAVALIHSAGGFAVLAHPDQNLGGDDGLLQGIISEKIDGLEVFSSYHSREASLHYLEIAEQNNLLVTCGSDFHGKNKPNIKIGGHGSWRSDDELISGIRKKLSEQG